MDDLSQLDAILGAQERLGHALLRARIGEDPALAGEVREHGAQFVQLFSGAIRMSRIHDADNEAFDKPMRELAAVLGKLVDLLGAVHVVSVEDHVYINEIRIRLKSEPMKGQGFGDLLHRHNVGAVTFREIVSEATMRRLLSCLAKEAPAEGRRAALLQDLVDAGVDGIELEGIYRFKMAGEDEGAQMSFTDPIERGLRVADEAWRGLGSGRMLNALPLRRIVTELIGSGLNDNQLWREMPEMGDHATHSLRVCRLALLVGQAIRLDQGTLQDLGVAAFVHDVGYANAFLGHEEHGARMMLRQRGFHEAKVRRILATLHHHAPLARARGPGMLFSRILRICDDYDNLTYRVERPLSPHAALRRMMSGAGSAYDPTLMQVLVNHLGAYPPGTWLRLDDGRVVQSVSITRTPDTFDRPRCQTVDGQVVDLAVLGMGATVMALPAAARPE